MQNFARLAKAGSRAAVPVAAGVVATASQPVTAHADAYAGDGLAARRIQDGWELAELEGKDVVLFKAEEIDDALSFLTGKPKHPTASAVIEEVDSDSSSDGTVDAVIEWNHSPGLAISSSSLPMDMQELCTLAGRLLKSPGVQREILSAAVTDPEVFSILASKMDLPEYLESAGFAAKGLLTGPTAAAAADSSSCSGSNTAIISKSSPEPGIPNPLLQLSVKIGEGVEQVGHAVARVGRWLRMQLTGDTDAATTAAEASSSAGGQDNSPRKAVNVMSAVMVICVAVVAVVLLRKPSALRAILRGRAA